jgi:branched-chain amino acid transport system permease protein
MAPALLLEQAFNGVQFGMMLFLLAVGVTLIFGIMNVINLAHGSMFMLGSYFLMQWIDWTNSYAAGVVLALLGIGVLSLLLERTIIRPLYRHGHLDQVLATFGLVLFFNELVVVLWGRDPLYIAIPSILSGQVRLFEGAAYPAYRLAITAVAALVGVALYFVIAKTRLGMLIRAGAEKRLVVEMMGVDISRIYMMIFALGGVLAGLAGMMTGPLLAVHPGMGEPILVLTLVVVIIGGVGSIRGALIASLLVGVLDTFGRVLLPVVFGSGTGNALSNMTVYILMAAILLWRPRGLFPSHAG